MDVGGTQRRLLRIAWGIEILAVTANALTALLVTMKFYNGDALIAVIAGLPFLVVAAAEISKIPFALTAMRVRWSLMPLFLSITLAMGSITCVTLFSSFERAYTYQMRSSEQTLLQIRHLSDETNSEKSSANSQKNALDGRRRTIVAQFVQQRDALDQQYTQATHDREAVTKAMQTELAGIDDRVRDCAKNPKNGNCFRAKDYYETRNRITERYKPRLAALDARVNDIDEQRSHLTTKEGDALALIEQSLAKIAAPAGVTDNEQQIDDLKAKEREQLMDVQVYRFAMMWYGHNDITQVTQEEATFIAKIFFGTIAILAAFAGPLLAIASQINERVPGSGRIMQWLRSASYRRIETMVRRWILRRRKKTHIVRTVEVAKEVPVEKIVEVTREIPVDRVVIKEVPVPKEVPVERVVYRDVVREVVRREITPIPILPEMAKQLEEIAERNASKVDHA